ncbi:MAG: Mini-ribonuclease 3 [Clostridia bacterium]|nr:Mini-ribonuclease 3 [Clostridia bacterium]
MDSGKVMEFSKAPNLYNPLVLAYIGDSLYDVYVRSRLIAENGDLSAHKLHVEAIRYVKAHGQSTSVLSIEDKLTDDELSAYKRGRNTKSFTVPKNADVGEYRRATGFEALLGWLYVSKKEDRLNQIMEMAYNAVTE